MLTAKHASNDEPAGTFTPINSYTSRVLRSCPSYATQVTNGKKKRVSIRWTAPARGFGCVVLAASVVQKGWIWFRHEGRLSLNICEREALPPSNATTNCCACGNATYRMTFYGLWSPTSHPKDYPAFSTHWSNVIGASHSREYSIWDYGEFASPAVQKVAEWGWPNDVETEVTSQGDHVMSLIKTPAQWPAYQPRNLRNPPSDTFKVDQSRHLVSLLSMLGPSPDWNVGITKETMCTLECGWIGTRVYNLTPWDAGTDSGVSYLSANSAITPHERIRALTSADDPESPFYKEEGGNIEPVARVVITRISLSGGQCGHSEPVLKQYSMTSQSTTSDVTMCSYGQWSDWSECAVTCGWGIKTRSRAGGLRKSPSECGATMEKEICQGSGECAGGAGDSTACLYSDWTSWGDCSVSCGAGLRVRNRVLMWPSEASNCREPLKEMTECAAACSSRDTCNYSAWGDWMPCPVTCGVGQTIRKRSVTAGSDCSAVMQNSKCMTSMSCDQDTVDIVGCVYAEWSDWSACPITCGIGTTFRKRMLLSGESNCEGFQMQQSKCMTSMTCPSDDQLACEYGEWSEWMPCSESCGKGATLRKKFLLGEDTSGNDCEGFVMENAACHNRPCSNESIQQQCVFLPWNPWMACSASCGKGETLRKRFLNQSASVDGCEGFQMEQNRCMVPCDVTSATICLYSQWSPWFPCAGGRLTGQTTRKKVLKFAPEGLTCDTFMMETAACIPVPVSEGESLQCSSTEWSGWSTCCRRERETRKRLQSSPNSGCVHLVERRRCQNTEPCPRDCVMGPWSRWSRCSVRKGRKVAIQIRKRRIRVRPLSTGAPCLRRKEKRRCNRNG
ncbi:spondin-1-like [Ciona intestinalis]